MEYTFTDWDRRSYERKTSKAITIESEQITGGKIKIALLESGKSYITLVLDKKETAGIISALGAANAQCSSRISI